MKDKRIKLQVSAGKCVATESVWFKRRFSKGGSEFKIYGWQTYLEWQGQCS